MPNINSILTSLNANYTQITDLVPNLYNFTDDIDYAVDQFGGEFDGPPLGQKLFRLSNGKLIWVGASGTLNNSCNVRRFTSDYELDDSFDPIIFQTNNAGMVRVVAEQSNGKIIIAGNFQEINGDSYGRIARINTDGTVDTTFNDGGSGFNSGVWSVEVLSDDSLIVAGDFGAYSGDSLSSKICKLTSNGDLVEEFSAPSFDNEILCSKLDETNEKIYVGGRFSNRIARLNLDGSLDESFYVDSGFDNRVACMALDSNGKLMVGGWFTELNNQACNKGIVRLTTEVSASKNITNIAISADGFTTITCNSHGLVTGNTITISESNSTSDVDGNWTVTVLNGNTFKIASSAVTVAGNSGIFVLAAGNIDATFETEGAGIENTNYSSSLVQTLAIQSNGKIVVGGWFNRYNEGRQGHILRLNTDGTRDTTLNIGFGFNDQHQYWGDGSDNGRVNHILINADGSIICTGNISAYDFHPINGFAKLSSTGELSSEQILKYNYVSGIDDGNQDMYDGGNFLNTDLTQVFEDVYNKAVDEDASLQSQCIPITHTPAMANESFRDENGDIMYSPAMDGVVKSGAGFFGDDSSYFTNMYQGMFVLVATDISINEFSVTGNVGSDSDTSNSTDIQVIVNGKTYTVFIKVNIEEGEDDPSINQLIIVPGLVEEITQTINDDNVDADDHLVRGLEGRTELYYILTARADAQALSFEDAGLVAAKFISIIDSSDPEITATFDASPTLRNLGTDGSLDFFDENGFSVQRTLNGILLERNNEYKMIGQIKDGQQFDNIVETLADYPFIQEN